MLYVLCLTQKIKNFKTASHTFTELSIGTAIIKPTPKNHGIMCLLLQIVTIIIYEHPFFIVNYLVLTYNV